MLIPPASRCRAGRCGRRRRHRWLRVGPDGRLYAINPEAGFFGVAPGTSPKTNPNAYATIASDTIFTNVALTADNEPWWEGLGAAARRRSTGRAPVRPEERPGRAPELALHRLRRSSARRTRPRMENPKGVPISAIVFGGRRARSRAAGVQAATGARRAGRRLAWRSETTAAATGAGRRRAPRPDGDEAVLRLQLRRLLGPLAEDGRKLKKRRRSSTSTGSARTSDGKFLWPGFGENLRVRPVP
jgi:phosphoenolpyruvate carboxykinase (GTP)